MSKLNLEFYKGTDVYSDGDIENEIFNITQKDDYIKNLRTSNNWAVLYHLTPERRNLLEWYDFNKNDEVLEIGAGCGALTEFFCEKVKSVTSVELSKRRAEIIQNRTKRFDNVEIIVGNLNDIKIDKQYDYITLVGVLEYAKSFTEGDYPYETFLKNIKQYLKPTGTLIVAIENQFGLKYWAGAREDHTGKFFDGIEGYPNDAHVKTFCKSELKNLLDNIGFNNIKFYYPYPDYKIPEQILTDETRDTFCNYYKNVPNYDQMRYVFFNEKAVMTSLIKNNIYGEFANSFLVFANNNDKSDTKLIYSRLRRELSHKYQLATNIVYKNSSYSVIKKPLTSEAKEHIDKIFYNNNILKNYFSNSNKFCIAECKSINNKLYFEYIEGDSLLSELSQISNLNDKSKIYKFIDYYISLLHNIYPNCKNIDFNTENIKEFQGTNEILNNIDCVQNPNIDLILNNIIKRDSKYFLIDNEWILDGYIPFNYIVYRAIFIQNYSELFLQSIPQNELLDYLQIDNKEFQTYNQMEASFMCKIRNKNINPEIKQQYVKEQINYTDLISEKERLLLCLSETKNKLAAAENSFNLTMQELEEIKSKNKNYIKILIKKFKAIKKNIHFKFL